MKVNIKLSDFLSITNLDEYKVHLACSDGETDPLELFYNNYHEWISWNEAFGSRNDFNRKYILSLIKDYSKENTYIFAGIFLVKNTIYGEKYEIEELTDFEEYKGRLLVNFYRYQGLRGRSFKLESFDNDLILKEILCTQKQPNINLKTNKPNLFDYATSELSQDAVFSWLISWANDCYITTDNELCILGKRFLSLLCGGMDIKDIHDVKVYRQWEHIDICVEINNDSVLIIEDKTGTSIHDQQLEVYKEKTSQYYKSSRKNIKYAYVKTENEPISIENEIKGIGYDVIRRNDLLKVLYTYQDSNQIVIDYRNHLQEIEDQTISYETLPVTKWDWYQWQGFYKFLETKINVNSWGYVSNPSGGFLGLWCKGVKNDEITMYLQFEESKLCIKICDDKSDNHTEIRNKYYDLLIGIAEKEEITIEKPARFGSGTFMTIGVVPKDNIFGKGIVCFNTLVNEITKYEQLINECIKS